MPRRRNGQPNDRPELPAGFEYADPDPNVNPQLPLFDADDYRESSLEQLARLTRRDKYRHEILVAPRWERRRAEYLDRHPYCEIGGPERIGCAGPLDVDHLTYDHVGDESDDELQTLCRRHHDEKHRRMTH